MYSRAIIRNMVVLQFRWKVQIGGKNVSVCSADTLFASLLSNWPVSRWGVSSCLSAGAKPTYNMDRKLQLYLQPALTCAPFWLGSCSSMWEKASATCHYKALLLCVLSLSSCSHYVLLLSSLWSGCFKYHQIPQQLLSHQAWFLTVSIYSISTNTLLKTEHTQHSDSSG